jgi:hypothetical protein
VIGPIIPAAIGLNISGMALAALAHPEWSHRQWPWSTAPTAALLPGIPGLVLFVVPHLWTETANGASGSYDTFLGWQIAWTILGIPLVIIVTIVFTALGMEGRSAAQPVSPPSPARRALYAMMTSVLAVFALRVGFMGIGFYYFWTNQAIPPIADHIQVGMLVLTGLCGLTSVAMLVRLVVVLVTRHRAEPRQI